MNINQFQCRTDCTPLKYCSREEKEEKLATCSFSQRENVKGEGTFQAQDTNYNNSYICRQGQLQLFFSTPELINKI